MPILSKNKYVLLLILCGCVGYWQLFQYDLKWDNINQFFPFRHFIAAVFNQGAFPFWNPYINLGYPIYGDPQSGVWYPFTYLNSLLSGYSFFSFNMEVLLHFILAGIGMYRVGQALKLSQRIAFCMGLCYMFCGWYVGSSQVYPWLIGSTWLPFIIAGLLQLRAAHSWWKVLHVAFFTSLTIVGAYPAFAIVLFYIFLLFFLVQLFESRSSWSMVRTWLLSATTILIICLSLCSGYLLSLYETFSFISRADALAYNEFFWHTSFTFQAMISFLLPFATVIKTEFFRSNLSILNGYIGTLGLPFLVLTIWKWKGRNKWLLYGSLIILLLAATGIQTPVRGWMYQFLPGFDMFRHPGFLRVFVLFGFILLIGKGLELFMQMKNSRKYLRRSLMVLLGLLFIIAAVSYREFELHVLKELWSVYWTYDDLYEFPISAHLFVQSCILLLLVGTALLLSLNGKLNKEGLLKYLSFLLFLDLFLATQMNIPVTVIDDQKIHGSDVVLKQMPTSFTAQTLSENINTIRDDRAEPRVPGTWRNQSILAKRTAFGGYNPFQLAAFNRLEQSELFEKSIDVPLLFLSDKVADIRTPDTSSSKILHFAPSDIGKALSFVEDRPAESEITAFEILPNKFLIRYSSGKNQFLTCVQNYMPNWAASIDGEEETLLMYNHALMALPIPKGEHEVVLEYRSKSSAIIFLFWLNTSLFLIGFLVMIGKELRLYPRQRSSGGT